MDVLYECEEEDHMARRNIGPLVCSAFGRACLRIRSPKHHQIVLLTIDRRQGE